MNLKKEPQFENKKLFEENEYKTNKYKRGFESTFEAKTILISDIWKFNDGIAYMWNKIKMLLEIIPRSESFKMRKGLNKIADDLEKIVIEMRNYTKEREVKDVEEYK